MQIGQIEAFVEVARQGSISRAAESLYLTQPTVTERVRTLEDELDDRLFTRVKYGVNLTDAGKVLLPYAQRVLQTIHEARGALENLREASGGTLSLGSAPFVSMYLLPSILERFAREYPGVHVAVRTGHSEEVLEMVLREEVQIGLVRMMKHPDIESITLHNDELILVAHPSHAFSRRDRVTLEEVAQEGVVSFDDANNYYKLVNAIFLSAGLAVKTRFEMDNVEAAKKIVEKGLGIALLPRIAVQDEVASGALRAVDVVGGLPLKRELAAIFRKAGGMGGIGRAFLATVAEMALAEGA